MACIGCNCGANAKSGDKTAGCNSNGCASGGCNRLNTYDWLTALDIEEQPEEFTMVEVSFKNGARKEFYKNFPYTRAITGDMVVVEADAGGYDIGRISLSGELVRLQMKKKNIRESTQFQSILRRANDRDLERLQEARDAEVPTMIQARAIARTLDLDMKIGDIEYQGDKRKATFYYTADGRVDFRELIRHYAKEFRVKIEMRQIGARQESARIGGLGSCGRELCCSTWLTDFHSVSTGAARYQNLAINQSKLSGQCGRLKCCLNYELDSYMDAIEHFPENAERLETEAGTAILVKTDIFKSLMFYTYERNRSQFFALTTKQVFSILEMNADGKRPADLLEVQTLATTASEDKENTDFEDVTGVIELPDEKKKRKKRKKKPENSDAKEAESKPKRSENNNDYQEREPKAQNNNKGERADRNQQQRPNRQQQQPEKEEKKPENEQNQEITLPVNNNNNNRRHQQKEQRNNQPRRNPTTTTDATANTVEQNAKPKNNEENGENKPKFNKPNPHKKSKFQQKPPIRKDENAKE